MTVGERAAQVLARGRSVALVRLARADQGGLTLAALCEMNEGDRDWDTHWDGCPYKVVGTAALAST